MPKFRVDQKSVKTLAKDLRATFGHGVGHKAIIVHICAALGWRDDVLMHHLKQFTEAGRDPFPAIAVPTDFPRELAKALSRSYVKNIATEDVERRIEPATTFEPLVNTSAEPIFSAVARAMVANGWSVFPQDITSRRPATVDGRMIRWAEEHDLVNRLPETDVLERWIEQCGTQNAAVVLGPASGNAFAIDIDCADLDLSADILALATAHLGETPLRRFGNGGNMMLLFRQADGQKIERGAHSFSFVPPLSDSKWSTVQIEIISKGIAVTMYGKHHKIGNYLRWLDKTPAAVGPDACPAVTATQLSGFLAAVATVPFVQRTDRPPADWSFNEDGLVNDGREAYLNHLATRATSGLDEAENDHEDLDGICRDIVSEFQATAIVSGKWSGHSLELETAKRVKRAISAKPGRFIDEARSLNAVDLDGNTVQWLSGSGRRAGSVPAFHDLRVGYTILCGPTGEGVNAALEAYIETRLAKGERMSLYADQAFSDRMAQRVRMSGTLWSARIDTFDWLGQEHPIHNNPELKFWARLRDDPDEIVIQDFADRGRFPNSEFSKNRADILAYSFECGHSAVAGMVSPSPASAIDAFANTITDAGFIRYNIDKLRLYYGGRDHSAELQDRLRIL